MSDSKVLKEIDVDKVFKERNPGVYKFIPGFVMRYIKRVVHQEEMNKIIIKGEHTTGIDFVEVVLNELNIKIVSKGLENLPKEGPVIIAGNHPLGGLDGLILIKVIGAIRKDSKFIVNDLLTNLPKFEDYFAPVNKLGGNAKSNLAMIDNLYASDKAVIILPAGLCSRKINGVVQDVPWAKSFVSKSQKYDHPILPLLVNARNSNWFYNLARFRKTVGIKANIEMLYLVDEMFKQKGKTIELIFGKPINPQILTKERSQKDWAEVIRAFVYNLAKQPDLDFEKFITDQQK